MTCLIPFTFNKSNTLYKGFIKVYEKEYEIQIFLKEGNDFQSARIDCEWQLKDILSNHMQDFKELSSKCSTIEEFTNELIQFIKKILDNKSSSISGHVETTKSLDLSFCRQVLESLEEVGFKNVEFLKPNLQEVHFSFKDYKDRKHIIAIYFNDLNFIKELPTIKLNLPGQFTIENNDSSLKDIYLRFKTLVAEFENFWDETDLIDGLTCVLEPAPYNRSACHRKIALGRAKSLLIDINPNKPRNMPSVKFLGNDKEVCKLKETFYKNYSKWDESKSVLRNLEAALEFSFPEKEDHVIEELKADCGICYSYSLEGQLPDTGCQINCNMLYHKSCLIEWLRSLSSTRQSFNVIFGTCPNCSQSITVKMFE